MTTEIRWRRGTAAQHAAFTGALGEITVDTTNKRLVVHDGGTAGGFPSPTLTAGAVPIAQGGTSATTAAGARAALSAAVSGTNGDITSLTGLSTALSVAQGGTASNNAASARAALGAAGLGANNDITSISALSTPLSIAQGGRGVNSLPVVSVTNSTTQTVATSVFTKMLFDTEETDTSGIHTPATGRIQPTVAGWYLLSSAFAASVQATPMLAMVYKNGVRHRDGSFGDGATGVTTLVFFNGSSDYAEIYCFQNSGSSATIAGAGGSRPYLQAVFIRS